MRSSTSATLFTLSTLLSLTVGQTDISPPFNPDASLSDVIISLPSITPFPTDIESVDPGTVTGEITLTYFTESDPILTGTPDPRPSNFPGTESGIVTESDGSSSAVATLTEVNTSVSVSGSLTTSVPVTTTRTSSGSASVSPTTVPASAGGRVDSGLLAMVGGVVVGVLGVIVGM